MPTHDSGLAPPPPDATIVIATRNRARELRWTLQSCASQVGVNIEIRVYDDASADGTAEMVADEFPDVICTVSAQPRDCVPLRNMGFREARGDVVVSLDDDSVLTDPETIAGVVRIFRKNPQLGAVALPYVEPFGPSRNQLTREPAGGTSLRAYVACSAAIRRSAVLEAGLYTEPIQRQGEERDLCIRLHDLGYDIQYGDTPHLIHLYSPKRDRRRQMRQGCRNTIFYNWLRLPFPEWLTRTLKNTAQLLVYQFRLSELPAKLLGLATGYAYIIRYWDLRQPVSRQTFRLQCKLQSHGPVPLDRLRDEDQTRIHQVLADCSIGPGTPLT